MRSDAPDDFPARAVIVLAYEVGQVHGRQDRQLPVARLGLRPRQDVRRRRLGRACCALSSSATRRSSPRNLLTA
jgi:hypothetical protein